MVGSILIIDPISERILKIFKNSRFQLFFSQRNSQFLSYGVSDILRV